MIYLILLISLLPFSYLIRFSFLGIPTTLLEVLIYIAVIFGLWQMAFNKAQRDYISKRFLSFKKWLAPIVIFILAGVISIIVTLDKRQALGLFKAYIFDPIMLFFIISYFVRERKDIDLIIKSLIISGVVVSVSAIIQKTTGQVTADMRVIGLFNFESNASPNYLSLYLAPLSLLAFTYGYSLKKIVRIWPYLVCFLLMLTALILSGSRAGIGAVFLGILVYLIIKNWVMFSERKFMKLLLYIFVILFMFLGYFLVKPDWKLSNTEGGRITSSNNIRWEIWKTTLKDIIPQNYNWIWGVGLGNYQNYFTNITKDRVNYPEWISPYAVTPHNLFLTIWVNLGLAGLMSFIWLLVIFIQNIKKSSHFYIIILPVMAVIILYGLIDSPYWKNDLSVIFWIILSLGFLSSISLEEK